MEDFVSITDKFIFPFLSDIILNFDNEDPGIPHNFDIFGDRGGYFVKTAFWILGPSKITYVFVAPPPGVYVYP